MAGLTAADALFTFAHLAFCAAAILARPAALIPPFLGAFTADPGDDPFLLAHLAFAEAAILASVAAERFPLRPSTFVAVMVCPVVAPPRMELIDSWSASISFRIARAFSIVAMGSSQIELDMVDMLSRKKTPSPAVVQQQISAIVIFQLWEAWM